MTHRVPVRIEGVSPEGAVEAEALLCAPVADPGLSLWILLARPGQWAIRDAVCTTRPVAEAWLRARNLEPRVYYAAVEVDWAAGVVQFPDPRGPVVLTDAAGRACITLLQPGNIDDDWREVNA